MTGGDGGPERIIVQGILLWLGFVGWLALTFVLEGNEVGSARVRGLWWLVAAVLLGILTWTWVRDPRVTEGMSRMSFWILNGDPTSVPETAARGAWVQHEARFRRRVYVLVGTVATLALLCVAVRALVTGESLLVPRS